MMRIGITQRVEVVAAYGERRDCLDQQWLALLESMNLDAVPVPNALHYPDAWAQRLELEGLVLTGGNDLADLPEPANPAPERDRTETALLHWAQERGLPVLGVCRGFQLMNCYLKGHLAPLEKHVATRHALAVDEQDGLFHNHTEVNSFHNWGIEDEGLAQALHVRARAEDRSIEAAAHESLPWVGIMWHPERELPFLQADRTLMDTLFRGFQQER